MNKLLILVSILAIAFATEQKNIAQIYNTCDLSEESYILISGKVDNLDDFPYEIKAIYFFQPGKLTFYEYDNAKGRQFVVDHTLECIEPGQVSWSDPQAKFFMLHNQKVQQKNANQNLRKTQETIQA